MNKTQKGHYVYKYVENGEIIYIGKSDDKLYSRVMAHAKEEKFYNHKDAEIFFAILNNKAETTVCELLLINKYKPRLNTAMKYKDDLTIEFIEPNWTLLKWDSKQEKQYKEGEFLDPWENKCVVKTDSITGEKYRELTCMKCNKNIRKSYGFECEYNTSEYGWGMCRICLCEECAKKHDIKRILLGVKRIESELLAEDVK